MKSKPTRPSPRSHHVEIDRRKGDEDVAERIAGGVRASFRPRERADDRPAPPKPRKRT